MLNTAMLNNEKIIAMTIALIMLFVAFKVVSSLLKPVIYVLLIWAFYMFVYHPVSLRADINTQVTRLSPEANYAVTAFNECRNAGSVANSIDACKQKIIDFAQTRNGAAYAAKVQASGNADK